ncbi:beta-lactamase superfamily domain [Catovirus CTV1]|uniref:Beta-lactamase superfamily domain n=1 Tax=Catovirus CTV1 TaxID=1977631 RepID=A0A1V0SBU2_9VIRU|nr:beta-lactamase superfamily domain [Catovirus CTV1]
MQSNLNNESPEQIYWNKVKHFKLPGLPYTLTGYSQAAKNTGFYIPELRMMLDCGVPNSYSPESIFITHCHLDHSGEIPRTLIDTGKVQPVIVVPKVYHDQVRNYIHATYCLTKNNPNPRIHSRYKLLSVVPEERPTIRVKNMEWIIDIVKCNHSVPCVGFGFSEIRNKLKDEYLNKSSDELRDLRRNGIEICDKKECPLFCFLGDTDHTIFENKDIVEKLDKYNIIIIECTFLDDEHIEHAIDDKHMHWTKLKSYVQKHTNTTFILIHFSARYTRDYIVKFFEREKHNNIVVWV